jgi:hypothetical protein
MEQEINKAKDQLIHSDDDKRIWRIQGYVKYMNAFINNFKEIVGVEYNA